MAGWSVDGFLELLVEYRIEEASGHDNGMQDEVCQDEEQQPDHRGSEGDVVAGLSERLGPRRNEVR